jgi:AcrR family transcriptional regulator
MARPKSLDKRNSILDAAADVFAERGLDASPTSEISKRAGVADGTLFTYFKSKDDLINALYCDIKLDLADALMSGFPRRKSVRSRVQHVWDSFTVWAVQNPNRKRAMDLLKACDRVTEQSREAGHAPFTEIETTSREGIESRVLLDMPVEFIASALSHMVDSTIEFMKNKPAEADYYRALGFELFWKGIARD